MAPNTRVIKIDNSRLSYLVLDLGCGCGAQGIAAIKCGAKTPVTFNDIDPDALEVESFQDFLVKLGIKPIMRLLEISTFSLNNVILRLTKIMNTADKYSSQIFFWKDLTNFRH